MSIRYTAEQLQRKFPGPAGSPGYARLADALRAEGRIEEAVDLCREGLRSRPLVAGYVVLGKSLADAGRLEEAREQFEAALRLDARCLSAMRALAGIMDKLKWADAAAGYYRSILEVEPWDREIRDLLQGGPAAPSPSAAPAPSVARAAEEETFVKPDGLEGDVMEVNLNDMADEFLPSGEDISGTALEDALSAGTRETPAEDYSPAPDPAAEPKPKDILAASPIPETSGPEAPAPISGSDVEERLDSLFGNETTGIPSATETWTAAPVLSDASDSTAEPRSLSFSPAEDAGAPDLSGIPGPAAETVFPGPASPAEAFTTAGADETLPESERVQGEDIERRLDELFNLEGEAEKPRPPAALSASDLPVAPAPVVGETVILGEAVAFGDGPAFAGADPSPAQSQGEIVTGQDVADKLDSLFGSEPQAETATAPESRPSAAESPAAPDFAAQSNVGNGFAGNSGAGSGLVAGLDTPSDAGLEAAVETWAGQAPVPDRDEPLLSTESMLPAAWQDGPRVTGADVEAQLDKLFDLEPADAPSAGVPVPGNLEGTVAFEEPGTPPREAADDGEKARLKESVADWLARREEPGSGPGPGDTLILPHGGMELTGADAPLLAEKNEEEAFGTLAPEEIAGLSETASIEMIDGGDVAERLDKLFESAPEHAAGTVPFADELPPQEFPLPEPDAGATLEVPIPVRPVGAEEDKSAADSAEITAGPGELSGIGQTPAPALAPMTDEEDGYPEEEDMSGQGAGANVATVTLAEIYFQQGLREQALQIYRQLSEREPENESVRKRIAEIEATRTDTEPGPGSDPRRPRPGLKVPKRKK